MKLKAFLLEDLECFKLSSTEKRLVLGGIVPKQKKPIDTITPPPINDDDFKPPIEKG